jgi:hypothetical protein
MSQTSPGEKRRRKAQRERRRIAYANALAAIKATGATCSTCAHYGKVPLRKKHCCELDSDFGGYVIVEPGDVCPRHTTPDRTEKGR